jgi:hypothetical protein
MRKYLTGTPSTFRRYGLRDQYSVIKSETLSESRFVNFLTTSSQSPARF